MDKISIIIPVYNAEPYISRCLDSVAAQTHDNLEILLINDGSTDGSGEICDEYAEKDRRVRVFHQPNQGVSSARNIGLKNLTGKYVGFADSDDWLEPEMYETLYKELENADVPICVCSYFKDTKSESVAITNRNKIPTGIISTKELLIYPLKRDYYMGFFGTLWNKLFSADVIKRSGVYFDETKKFGEDTLFYPSLVANEKCTGIYIDKPLYHWYQRDISNSKSRSLRFKTDIMKAYKEVEGILSSNGYSEDSFWARGFYCHHASIAAEIALENGDETVLCKMQSEIRAHLPDYIKTNEEFPEKLERMNKILNVKLFREEGKI